jgi:hypothetical protein
VTVIGGSGRWNLGSMRPSWNNPDAFRFMQGQYVFVDLTFTDKDSL